MSAEASGESSYSERLELIEALENRLNTRIIVYFLGDRPIASAVLAGDALEPLNQHLKDIGATESLTLFLYGQGGNLQEPWKIINMCRECSNELNVIIPYKAYSAITLTAVGADKIYMGTMGMLGAIDPQFNMSDHPSISVEDVYSFLNFIQEHASLADQQAVSEQLKQLNNEFSPSFIGKIERTHQYIRDVAKDLLLLHKDPLSDAEIDKIVETLTEKIYLHGHGISRRQAKEIGLPVVEPDQGLIEDIIQLYQLYKRLLKLDLPPKPEMYFQEDQDLPGTLEGDLYKEEGAQTAIIESSNLTHAYQGTLKLKRERKIPSNPDINISINAQLPAGINQNQLPQSIQQKLQKKIQGAQNVVVKQVQEQIKAQSPIVNIKKDLLGQWKQIR
ncbi:hypothetical protein KGY77_08275 [Candidatus Bipolaricaulota bacterium]|nr:hypothetical protein [Candidatus Bipolaricaulota bacterium]